MPNITGTVMDELPGEPDTDYRDNSHRWTLICFFIDGEKQKILWRCTRCDRYHVSDNVLERISK